MPTCMCLLDFQRSLKTATTAAQVRKSHERLPTSCIDSRCSPGGCQSNCADYAAGAILTINRTPQSKNPPKIKPKGKR